MGTAEAGLGLPCHEDHLYLYSTFNNTDCVKAALQYYIEKIVCYNTKGQQ